MHNYSVIRQHKRIHICKHNSESDRMEGESPKYSTPDLFLFPNISEVFDIKNSGKPDTPYIVNGLSEVDFSSIGIMESKMFIINSESKLLCSSINPEDEEFKNSQFKTPKKISNSVIFYSVSCGANHCVACGYKYQGSSAVGVTYTYGSNMYNQLGRKVKHSDDFGEIITPSVFIQASCGANFTVLLSSVCEIYVCGSNRYGQLGFDPKKNPTIPELTIVKQCAGIPVVGVATGLNHTLILSSDGRVYSVGDNRKGQLGINNFRQTFEVTEISILRGIVKIYAFANYSAAINEYGNLFLWGEDFGDIPTQFESDENFVDVAFGRGFVAQLTSDGKVYLRNKNTTTVLVNRNQGFFSLVSSYNDNICIRAGLGHPFPSNFTDADKTFIRDPKYIIDNIKSRDVNGIVNQILSSENVINGIFDKYLIKRKGNEIIDIFDEIKKDAATTETYRKSLIRALESALRNADYLNTPSKLRFLYVMLLSPSALIDRNADFWKRLIKAIDTLKAKDFIESWILSAPLSEMKTIYNNANDLLTYEVKMSGKYSLGISEIIDYIKFIRSILLRCNLFGDDFFYNNDLSRNISVKDEYNNFQKRSKWTYIGKSPYLLNMAWKLEFIKLWSATNIKSKKSGIKISITRERIVEEMISVIRGLQKDKMKQIFQTNLEIVFIGEAGKDATGLTREFLTVLSEGLVKKGFFDNTKNYIWFSNKCSNLDAMYLSGVLVSLSIIHNEAINLLFPPALFKKIKGIPIDKLDTKEVFPDVYQSFLNLIKDKHEVSDAFLNFSYIGDDDKDVNEANLNEYIDKYTEYMFNTSIKDQYEAFKSGFTDTCDDFVIRILSPEELCYIINGTNDIDFSELKKNVKYFDCNENNPAVRAFWEVVTKRLRTQQEKEDFLFFFSGLTRVPPGGLASNRFQLEIMDRPDALPQGHTCFFKVDIPNQYDVNVMERKIKQAISLCKTYENR